MFRKQIQTAITMTVVLCLLTGVAYPGIVTGLARLLFPRQANGSLVEAGGRIVGSALIGQRFTRPWYFHPRPSAAGAGYDAAASGASNKGPTDRQLADTLVGGRADSLVAAGVVRKGAIPTDMVTASGSGLDPHISPANAALQAPGVAAARGVPVERVRAILAAHTEGRQFGIFGEPRVNVLLLNVALDSAFGSRR